MPAQLVLEFSNPPFPGSKQLACFLILSIPFLSRLLVSTDTRRAENMKPTPCEHFESRCLFPLLPGWGHIANLKCTLQKWSAGKAGAIYSALYKPHTLPVAWNTDQHPVPRWRWCTWSRSPVWLHWWKAISFTGQQSVSRWMRHSGRCTELLIALCESSLFLPGMWMHRLWC